MSEVVLDKTRLASFVSFLSAARTVVAPVALERDQARFAEVESLDRMTLKSLPTLLPPKKYFLPPYETLLTYDTRRGQTAQPLVEVEEVVLFGVHTCDLAGIQCLNLVFTERPKDLNYLIRKKHLILIGLECPDYCDKAACCGLLQTHLPMGGYDLFLTELEDVYFGHANTHTGEQLVNESGLFRPVDEPQRRVMVALRASKELRFKHELPGKSQDLPRLLEESCESKVWAELGEKCLACGNCTNVCPTCYCFDVVDEPEFDQVTGRRIRVWDSCQSETFAKVAGGESFRASRSDRQRHRYQRKFQYPMNRYGRLFCTGCGRCSRTCMAGIDLQLTLKALLEERG